MEAMISPKSCNFGSKSQDYFDLQSDHYPFFTSLAEQCSYYGQVVKNKIYGLWRVNWRELVVYQPFLYPKGNVLLKKFFDRAANNSFLEELLKQKLALKMLTALFPKDYRKIELYFLGTVFAETTGEQYVRGLFLSGDEGKSEIRWRTKSLNEEWGPECYILTFKRRFIPKLKN